MSKEARLRITTLLICVLTTTAPALLAQQLPSPESVLGHRPGDDFFLATYDESLQYFKQLEQSTDKLRLVNVGQTSNGLEWQIALISSSENLARIDRYKQIAGQLAWARDLAPGSGPGSGARVGPRRESDRPHRRRPACHGSGSCSTHDSTRLRSGQR